MGFNKGDTATGAMAVDFELDLTKSEEFVKICINSLSESLNSSVETWYDLCSNGFSSSAVVAHDAAWSGEGVIRYDEPTAEMAKLRYSIEDRNNIPMRITNRLLDEQVTVLVSLTSFDLTIVAEELIKFSFELKPSAGAPSVTTIEAV